MRKPKIALVNVFFPPQTYGGATTVLSDNLEILTTKYEENFEIVGFTTNYDSVTPYSMECYATNCIRVYSVGAEFQENMDWRPQNDRMRSLFVNFLDFEKPDLVHFHCVQRLSASVVEEAVHRGLPTVVTVHDAWWISDHQFLVDFNGVVYPHGHPDIFATVTLPKGILQGESLSRHLYLRSLLNSVDSVMVVSASFAKIYALNGINGLIVAPNGLRRHSWLPKLPSASGRVRIGHIGGIAKHKGYPLCQKAFLAAPHDHLEMVIVDLSQDYGYNKFEKWGGAPVTFLGKFPQNKIEELYSQLDVLVAPSIWPESYGLVTREAAAAGLWVVASSLGGISEEVRDGVNGFRVDVQDHTDLQRIFSQVNSDPGKFLISPPQFPLRYVEDQVAQIVDVYRNLLQHGSRHRSQIPPAKPGA